MDAPELGVGDEGGLRLRPDHKSAAVAAGDLGGASPNPVSRHDPLEAVNLLDLAPRRLAEWCEDASGRVVLERPRPAGRGPRHWLEWLGFALSSRRIRLDRAGSLAWRLMDGRRTVGEVAEALRSELGAEVEPAEERLGHLVRLLRREELVAYGGWDSEAGAG